MSIYNNNQSYVNELINKDIDLKTIFNYKFLSYKKKENNKLIYNVQKITKFNKHTSKETLSCNKILINFTVFRKSLLKSLDKSNKAISEYSENNNHNYSSECCSSLKNNSNSTNNNGNIVQNLSSNKMLKNYLNKKSTYINKSKDYYTFDKVITNISKHTTKFIVNVSKIMQFEKRNFFSLFTNKHSNNITQNTYKEPFEYCSQLQKNIINIYNNECKELQLMSLPHFSKNNLNFHLLGIEVNIPHSIKYSISDYNKIGKNIDIINQFISKFNYFKYSSNNKSSVYSNNRLNNFNITGSKYSIIKYDNYSIDNKEYIDFLFSNLINFNNFNKLLFSNCKSTKNVYYHFFISDIKPNNFNDILCSKESVNDTIQYSHKKINKYLYRKRNLNYNKLSKQNIEEISILKEENEENFNEEQSLNYKYSVDSNTYYQNINTKIFVPKKIDKSCDNEINEKRRSTIKLGCFISSLNIFKSISDNINSSVNKIIDKIYNYIDNENQFNSKSNGYPGFYFYDKITISAIGLYKNDVDYIITADNEDNTLQSNLNKRFFKSNISDYKINKSDRLYSIIKSLIINQGIENLDLVISNNDKYNKEISIILRKGFKGQDSLYINQEIKDTKLFYIENDYVDKAFPNFKSFPIFRNNSFFSIKFSNNFSFLFYIDNSKFTQYFNLIDNFYLNKKLIDPNLLKTSR